MNIVLLERGTMGADLDISGFGELGTVTWYSNTTTPEQVRERVREADIVVANKAPLNRQSLAEASRLKLICEFATGYDNCDIPYCREKGILVCNAANYSTAMVAQHTFALALALSQKLMHYDRYVKSGAYSAQDRFTNFDEPFSELDGKTWGIVGMGHIGSRVAAIAQALGCRVICHSVTGSAKPVPYERVDKAALLAQSDVLSLHCPLSDQSRHFIDQEALGRMKPTAYLINVARGPVVDQRALARALNEGWIAGAAVDVLDREPLPADDPLLAIQDSGKLIVTPHLAWASVEARRRCLELVYGNIRAFQAGRPRSVVWER